MLYIFEAIYGYSEAHRFRVVKIRSGIHDSRALFSGRKELVKFLNKFEPIRIVIIDVETKERVSFSQENMKKVEIKPISYAWTVYTIIPQGVIDYLSKQENRSGYA